jgi:hypothetical protein
MVMVCGKVFGSASTRCLLAGVGYKRRRGDEILDECQPSLQAFDAGSEWLDHHAAKGTLHQFGGGGWLRRVILPPEA